MANGQIGSYGYSFEGNNCLETLRSALEEKQRRLLFISNILNEKYKFNGTASGHSNNVIVNQIKHVLKAQICNGLSDKVLNLEKELVKRLESKNLVTTLKDDVHYKNCLAEGNDDDEMNQEDDDGNDINNSDLPWAQIINNNKKNTKNQEEIIDYDKVMKCFMNDVNQLKNQYSKSISVKNVFQDKESKDEEAILMVEKKNIPIITINEQIILEINELYNLSYNLALDTLYKKDKSKNEGLETYINNHKNLIDFTNEESYGRYLDFNNNYSCFLKTILYKSNKDIKDNKKNDKAVNRSGIGNLVNLLRTDNKLNNNKNNNKISYLDYIKLIDKFDELLKESNLNVKETKSSDNYINYLNQLLNYLIFFIKRSDPLFDIDNHLIEIKNNFNNHNENEENNNNALYCKYCKKVFEKETVFNGHLKGKKHIKNEKNHIDRNNHKLKRNKNNKYLILEYQISSLLNNKLKIIRNDTISRIERRSTLNLNELMKEDELIIKDIEISNKKRKLYEVVDDDNNEDDNEDSKMDYYDDDDDDDKKVYNPLKLPLGWDGKPIPYWLYKLNGLSIEFTCEICGNFVYKGRKNFDKHFQEAKHIYGMKCLGIPNTKHFYGITKIEDVKSLWLKIKNQNNSLSNQQDMNNLDKDNVEEYEDAQGNVYTKAQFNNLKKQGII